MYCRKARAKLKTKKYPKTTHSTNTAVHPAAVAHRVKLNTCAKAGQRGLTEGLQAGLDELLPACPLGEVSQGHHGFTRGGWGRAGFVEPVRTAWGRNSRPGAASWSHSPSETPTQKE